jgi:hypothetical protein
VGRARLDREVEHARVQQHNLEEMRKAVHRADESRDSWKALYDGERERNDRLVEKLLNMKQQGFQTAADRQALPAQPQSKIEDAISERAGSNGALRRHLSRWAAQRQAMNIPEEDILDALVKWRDPDEDAEGAEA